MRNNQAYKNLIANVDQLIWSIFGTQEKSQGITIIPKGLRPVKNARFKGYDKEKFYKIIKKLYPRNAANIYRIMAIETTHFTSGQFIYTGSGGMEVHKEAYPYGWTVANSLWKNSLYRPDGYKIMTDKAGRRRAFLAFKSPVAFAATLNAYLNKYQAGRWYSTNAMNAARYEAYIANIKLPKV